MTEVLLTALNKAQQMSSNIAVAPAETEELSPCEKNMVKIADKAEKHLKEIKESMKQSEGRMEQHFKKMEEKQALRKKDSQHLEEAAKAGASPVTVVQKSKKKALSLLSIQNSVRVNFHSRSL